MPLQTLNIKPGIVTDVDEYTAAKVGPYWIDSDKIRFVNGLPQKIGGWSKESATPTTATSSTNLSAGKVRRILNWRLVDGTDVTALGSDRQLLILLGGTYYDITPLRTTAATLGANPITTSSGSSTVTVTHTSHGADTGEIVSFSGAAAVNGVTLSGAYELTKVDTNSYTVVDSATASGSGSGGGSSVVASYLIGYTEGMLEPTAALALGWGTGTWGLSTWGTARSSSSVTLELSQWSFDLWGEDLVATVHNYKTYVWDASAGVAVRAAVIDEAEITKSRFTTVSFPDRHLVAHGTYNTGTSAQDNMLVRWSDQEDYTQFTASTTNTAGSQRLQVGTKIMSAVPTREATFIGTDEAMYEMQFVGAPFIFSFRLLGTGCGPIAQNSMVNESGVVYWMGRSNFFVYDGQIKELPCPVQYHIFDDLNQQQQQKIFGAINRKFQEVIWFYCSDDAADDEPDKYVTYNFETGVWTIGSLQRTAWHDQFGVRLVPYAIDKSGYLYNQETGTDADGSAMTSYIESSAIEFDSQQAPDGTNLFMIDKFIPAGTITGSLDLTVKSKKYPQDASEVSKGPFTISPTTTKVSLRAKGRQMKVRFSSDATGDNWELGTFRFNLRPDGQR
jgi:hypothetical protein|tara:strand:+ start:1698 stop:3548 length:1851 start_codon:yes stop_codon:yes gene_type:complete